SRLDAQDRRLRSRKERARWIWALACIAALIGCVVCPWLALSAYHHGSRGFYALVFLSVSCLVVAVISYTACRYHTAID
ncbi:MAG TPA: hypothetical protein VHE61_15425, partial [Opitutaceae bacterium]|nr:hypothetical protein [Opitutaceae bacterium]